MFLRCVSGCSICAEPARLLEGAGSQADHRFQKYFDSWVCVPGSGHSLASRPGAFARVGTGGLRPPGRGRIAEAVRDHLPVAAVLMADT